MLDVNDVHLSYSHCADKVLKKGGSLISAFELTIESSTY